MKTSKIIIALCFFLLGLGVAFVNRPKNSPVTTTSISKQENKTSFNWLPKTWTASESAVIKGQTGSIGNDKFSIYESQKIISDRKTCQTGEDISFSATLKNQGTQKKFFTHLCFNHSGGVTFGCLLGVNLDPGQEFPITAKTKFYQPGNFSVWLTWSQDGTNYYRPLEAGSVSINVK